MSAGIKTKNRIAYDGDLFHSWRVAELIYDNEMTERVLARGAVRRVQEGQKRNDCAYDNTLDQAYLHDPWG
ncbi:MAG: hypothetical protein WCA78_05535 [Rhizomicrobium sp.]